MFNSVRAERFREVFMHAFPSVKRIIISDSPMLGQPHTSGIPEELSILAHAFSPHVTIFISLREGEARLEFPHRRKLYWMDGASQWIASPRAWTRHRVLAPTENIKGIVGAYLRYGWNERNIMNEISALPQLRLEVYEKYHFGGEKQIPFVCPHPGCEEEIRMAGEWTRHV
jgi:hypothetical protein